MATEFFGQWLGFYHFDQFRGVDIQRFPEFNDKLQDALYDEAISFFEHIIRHDRPYSEIIHADYSLLNATAASHYGIPFEEVKSRDGAASELPNENLRRRIEIANHNRGGLLGLGAVLTSTSAPLRTSPVKRGDWVLRRLLGTPVPPPPADAGSIPAEEVLSDGLTVRERLEAHRTSAECMNCHIRIDPLGFALENFDSLGRWRDRYLDDQPIDASGKTADGTRIEGILGLKNFLKANNQLVRRTLAAKLVAYALGRPETVFDTALIDQISSALAEDPKFSTAIIALVRSPQFQQRHRSDQVAGVAKSRLGETPNN
jgi:hypothetical protein